MRTAKSYEAKCLKLSEKRTSLLAEQLIDFLRKVSEANSNVRNVEGCVDISGVRFFVNPSCPEELKQFENDLGTDCGAIVELKCFLNVIKDKKTGKVQFELWSCGDATTIVPKLKLWHLSDTPEESAA